MFDSNIDIPVTCGSCGAHFQTSPSGSIDGAACSECGGKRFFRNQPNPTQSDGTLRDMVDSDSQVDMGGNPLGEGTIMGRDGEQNMGASTHGRDNFMHSHVMSFLDAEPGFDSSQVAQLAHQRVQQPDGGITIGLDGQEHQGGGYGVALPSSNIPTHVTQLTPQHFQNYIHQNQELLSQPGNYFGAWHDPKDGNVYPDISQIHPDLDTAMQAGRDRNQEAIWDFANNQSIPIPQDQRVAKESAPSDHLSHRMREYRPETLNMEPYAPLWSDDFMKDAGILGDVWDGIKDVAKNPIVDMAGLGALNLIPGVGEVADAGALAGGAADAADTAGTMAEGLAAPTAEADAGAAAPGLMNRAMGLATKAAPISATESFGRGFENGENGGQPGVAGGNSGYATPSTPLGMQQLAAIDIPALLMLSDFETSDSVKSVDEQHDDPEKQDQKEFNDGDKSPSNIENPNNEDSGASGEDGARSAHPGYGFGPNSPAIQRLMTMMPLLVHYIENGISGADDPLVQGLHEALEAENPGYLDQAGPEGDAHVQLLIDGHKAKHPKQAGSRLSLDMGPSPASGVSAVPMPGSDIRPATPQFCPRCGAVMSADGTCPQCGFKLGPQGGGQVSPMGTSGPGALHMANHQGPVTDEQKQAIKQLIDVRPELFSDILDKVQNQPNTAPLVDPSPAPPAMPPAPQGAMPSPDMSQPGGGMGQPMQPMANARFADANNMIPRCPKCGTATTSYMEGGDDQDHLKARCHGCGNVFPLKANNPDNIEDGVLDRKKESRFRLVALGEPTLNLPAADQQMQPNMGGPAGGIWKDGQGNDLQQGQIYSLHSPQYPVPDEVQIVSIKPHELGVKLVGEFGNIQHGGDPNAPDFRLKPEDMTSGKYTFEPSGQSSSDQGAGAPPLGGTPGQATIPDQGMTTDQQTDTYPNPGTASMASVRTAMCKRCNHASCNGHCESCVDCMDADAGHISSVISEDVCHKCGGDWIEHTASSPTKTMHECARCLAAWETDEEDFERQANVDLSWINESGPGHDDFFDKYDSIRQGSEMMAGQASRNIGDIAARDTRAQQIHALLEANKMAKEAGKHFSPREQRDLINEHGHARNADMLDLSGTHYENTARYEERTQFDPTGKVNGENVPDGHLVFGL